MKKGIVILLVLVSAILISWKGNEPAPGFKTKISEINLKANLTYLASDELEGREAGTRGETVASGFISSELKKYGVLPFGDNGTYFQNYNLATTIADSTSEITLLDASGKEQKTFHQKLDILIGSGCVKDINVTTDFVFVGYGITADEYQYDDYKGLDVKGKVVVAIEGEPENGNSTYFHGADESKYSETATKVKIAQSKGAIAILLTSKSVKTRGWERVARRMTAPSTDVAPDAENGVMPYVVLKETTIEQLLAGNKTDYNSILKSVESKSVIPKFTVQGQLKLKIKAEKSNLIKSRNIIGMIEGNDPVLKNQFVAVSAHYDHVGVSKGEVYNGADDDGSGTVGVLEVARVLSADKNHKRSFLIIFHAAEEKGLLGSEYLTSHFSRMRDIVSLVNMDMIGREYQDSIHVIGSDKLSKDYHNLIIAANKKTVNMTFDFKYNEPSDPNRFYYRSDHYNYAKNGIPIVFFFDDMRRDYHQASDEVQFIDFTKIAKVATLAYTISMDVANLDNRLKVDSEPKN